MDRLNQNYCWSFSGIKRKFAFYRSSIQEINAHHTICNKTQQSPQQTVNVTFFAPLSLKRFYSSHICVNSISIFIIPLSFIFFIIACFPLSYLFYLPRALHFPLDRLSIIAAAFFHFIALWGLAVNQSLTGSRSHTEWVTGAVWQREW